MEFCSKTWVEDKYWDNGEAPVDLAAEDKTFEPSYILEFYGVKTTLDEIDEEFTVTQEVSYADAVTFFESNKRIFVGAQYADFEPNYVDRDLVCRSDAKTSSVRYWVDCLMMPQKSRNGRSELWSIT